MMGKKSSTYSCVLREKNINVKWFMSSLLSLIIIFVCIKSECITVLAHPYSKELKAAHEVCMPFVCSVAEPEISPCGDGGGGEGFPLLVAGAGLAC